MDIYFDVKNKLNTDIDKDQGFLYKHKFAKDLLEVSILRFGEKDLYEYGHLNTKIP